MLAYDRANRRAIAFGGNAAGGPSNETWSYNGIDWSRIVTPTAPPPRFDGGLIYYAPRQRIIVTEGAPGPLVDTWEFDGATWTPVISPTAPSPRGSGMFLFDEGRRALLAHNGDASGEVASTWEFTYSSTSLDEQCAQPGDEDGDGLENCDDPDCDRQRCGPAAFACHGGACVCAGGAAETLCGDQFDDDCDGLVDCADDDCAASATCSAESDCGNGVDDDNDGYTDCQDPGCIGTGGCQLVETNCDDSIDNDSDGRVDCQDTSCYLLAPCTEVTP